MDSEHDDNEKNVQNAKTWSKYADRLTNPVVTSENNATTTTTNQQQTTTTTSSSSTTTTTTSTANSNPNAETSPDIKEEKLDDEVVSG